MRLKLFLKHLFRGIKLRPAQPILLILIIALAVTASIASFDIKAYLSQNENESIKATYGYADYFVSVNSFSSTRFIILEKDKELFPEGVDVCGAYGLPLTYGEKNDFVYGVATDLKTIDNFFDIDFIASLPLYENQSNRCLFVCKEWANRYGITVGQEIPLDLLGQTITFTVYGIADKKFMGTYSVMFDITAIMGGLLSQSAIQIALDDNLVFAGTLYIRSNGIIDDEFLTSIFPDFSVSGATALYTSTLGAIGLITVMIELISLLFVVMVIFCCFHILSSQRQEETNLFFSVGADKKILNLFSSLEMFLYWIVGSIIGIYLSMLVARLFISYGNLTYCTPTFHTKEVLISLLLVLVASQASLLLFVLSDERQKKKKIVKEENVKKEICFTAIILALSLLFSLLCLFLPVSYKATFGVVAIVLMGVTSFFFARTGIKLLAKHLGTKKNLPPTFLYALKNISRVKTLTNTTGLVALFFSTLFVLSTLLVTAQSGIVVNKIFLRDEYLVLNANQSAIEQLEQAEGVEKVHSLYRENIVFEGEDYMLSALSDREVLFEGCAFDTLPEGDECYINSNFAKKHGLNIGDRIQINIGQKVIDVVYKKGIDSGCSLLIVDGEYWNLPMTYYTIQGEKGVDSDTLLKNIMESQIGQSTSVVSGQQFMQVWAETISSYVLCIEITAVFIVLFSVIGMADNIASSYRSRKEEFACYIAAGMNKKMLRKLKTNELGVACLVGIVSFLIFSALLLLVLDRSLYTYCTSVIWSIRESGIF